MTPRLSLAVAITLLACATTTTRPAAPVHVALNNAPLPRHGCPFEPCPPETPYCLSPRDHQTTCGGAAIPPCPECGAFEHLWVGDCGRCACFPDCRLPFVDTPAANLVCDTSSGAWRERTCADGAPCATHERCVVDRCEPLACTADVQCPLGVMCHEGRCAPGVAGTCAAELPSPPP